MINLERGWRGGERQTWLTALGLQEVGIAITVLVRTKGELAKRLAASQINSVECSSSVAALLYLLRSRKRYSHYHAQTSSALTWLAMLRPLLQGAVVFTRRTAFPLTKKDQSPRQQHKQRRSLQWKWGKADAFVAISQAAAADPIQLGFNPRIIPSAVEFVAADTEHIVAFSEQHQLNGRYVLGTVAALSAEKDPLTTVRAVHELWQQRQDFVFLHVGAEGNASAEVRALIQQLGLNEVYKLVGFEARIEDIYRLLHVFVLSSTFEALGSSVLDAFLYAAPVVVTQTGGLVELVADERGIVCAVGDYHAIAAACNRLLDDEELRKRYVLKALEWVQSTHSVPQMVHSYIELYQELTIPNSKSTL